MKEKIGCLLIIMLLSTPVIIPVVSANGFEKSLISETNLKIDNEEAQFIEEENTDDPSPLGIPEKLGWRWDLYEYHRIIRASRMKINYAIMISLGAPIKFVFKLMNFVVTLYLAILAPNPSIFNTILSAWEEVEDQYREWIETIESFSIQEAHSEFRDKIDIFVDWICEKHWRDPISIDITIYGCKADEQITVMVFESGGNIGLATRKTTTAGKIELELKTVEFLPDAKSSFDLHTCSITVQGDKHALPLISNPLKSSAYSGGTVIQKFFGWVIGS